MPLPVPVGATTTALSTAVPAITSAGSSLLPQLFNALAMNSMLKAMPKAVAPAYIKRLDPWHNVRIAPENEGGDIYDLEDVDNFTRLVRNASNIQDVLTNKTLGAFREQAIARAWDPYMGADHDSTFFPESGVDPEMVAELYKAHTNVSNAMGLLDPEEAGNPWVNPYDWDSYARQYRQQSSRFDNLNTLRAGAHKNNALGRWFAQHGNVPPYDDLPF